MKFPQTRIAFGSLILGIGPGSTLAQPPSYGIDFVTIGDAGNAPCTLPNPGGGPQLMGRGAVGYEYRIARTEVTTGQWMEFVNTYAPLGGSWIGFGHAAHWGAEIDPTYIGPGLRYRLRNIPNAAGLPVGGIDWREAAMYCNWLTNGKSPTVAAVQNGAYDTSTFTTNPNGTFNDQIAHHPGAPFWIPTLDEWIKAAHYDPNRHGTGQGGWWMYPNRSDVPLVYGPPGEGQANAGFELPQFGNWMIPLGAYSTEVSPWGLLDCAGATSEWLEEAYVDGPGFKYRGVDGSASGWDPSLSELEDRVTLTFSNNPWIGLSYQGFRIASSVPSPAAGSVLLVCSGFIASRRRRRTPCEASSSARSSWSCWVSPTTRWPSLRRKRLPSG